MAKLTDIGPPPYANILDYEPALSAEMEVYPDDHSRNAEGPGQVGEGIGVGEYSLVFQGRHEARCGADLGDTWFAMLDVPRKQMTVADPSGHRPRWEQPVLFHDFMTQTVLVQTQPTR